MPLQCRCIFHFSPVFSSAKISNVISTQLTLTTSTHLSTASRSLGTRLVRHLPEACKAAVYRRRQQGSKERLTGVRFVVNLIAAIAALYHPFYGAVIKLLDEFAKIVWNDLTGYKRRIKQIEELQKMQPRIDWLIEAFRSPVDRKLVRNS